MGLSLQVQSQSVGIGTITPDSTSALDIHSNNKGFLMPRLSIANRDGITNPATGLQIYNTTNNKIEFFESLKSCPLSSRNNMYAIIRMFI